MTSSALAVCRASSRPLRKRVHAGAVPRQRSVSPGGREADNHGDRQVEPDQDQKAHSGA